MLATTIRLKSLEQPFRVICTFSEKNFEFGSVNIKKSILLYNFNRLFRLAMFTHIGQKR
ncbi:hypothetical protein J26TS2_23790 [Shouchella clausii]|nr:hypothetical protein J26TS2_23790 [Shouchella clausii]